MEKSEKYQALLEQRYAAQGVSVWALIEPIRAAWPAARWPQITTAATAAAVAIKSVLGHPNDVPQDILLTASKEADAEVEALYNALTPPQKQSLMERFGDPSSAPWWAEGRQRIEAILRQGGGLEEVIATLE